MGALEQYITYKISKNQILNLSGQLIFFQFFLRSSYKSHLMFSVYQKYQTQHLTSILKAVALSAAFSVL